MSRRTCMALLIVFALTVAACGSAGASPTPTPTPTPAPTLNLPTYSVITAGYPASAKPNCTDAHVSKISGTSWTFSQGLICTTNGSQLTVAAGGVFTFPGSFPKAYYMKITVDGSVTIDGHDYVAGDMLTVDKDLVWVQVSSWS